MKVQVPRASFMLIDGAQLALADIAIPDPDKAPAWLTYVYESGATAVSPLVIDIDAAYGVGGADEVSAFFTALQPKAHVSLIDTTLSHAALTQHLRRFIMVRAGTGRAYTLRFADCTVLATLAAVLTGSQWAAIAGPMGRWCVHGFDDALRALPAADIDAIPAQTPLVLAEEQIAALAEAGAPSMMLAHLLDMNHGEALPGSAAEQHRWASAARAMWQGAANADEIVLRWLTSATLETKGKLLDQAALRILLERSDPSEIRNGLRAMISECHARWPISVET